MSGLKIPFIDLSRQYNKLRDELQFAQNKVYSSGRMLDGEYVAKFENAMALRCNRYKAVAVNSCTQALIFANIITDDGNSGVLIPAFSFVATVNSVLMSKRQVYFADVNNQGLIHIERFPEHVNTVVLVDLYGNVVEQIVKPTNKKMYVIEDAAQSFGASLNGKPAGSFGDISCISFDPMKNLPNYGSGGMLLTNDERTYRYALNLRDNGKANGSIGTNSKMSESDCACMLVKLKYFDQWQKRRAQIAKYYNKELLGCVDTPNINENVIPSWHKYVIQSNKRDFLKRYLDERGVETKIHYEKPLGHGVVAEQLSKRVLSLPIYPELTDEEVEYVAQMVVSYWKSI